MKKFKFLIIVLVLSLFVFVGCVNEPTKTDEEKDDDPLVITEYTVSFDNESVKVKQGEKVTKPSTPSKEGFTFLGWYNGEELFDFETVINQDYNLVSKYKAVLLTVTYHIDEETNVINVEYGNKTTKPVDPTKENYDFIGWRELDSTENFDFNNEIKTNLDLYATFKIKQFNINFYIDDEINITKVDYNTAINKPNDPSKEGFTFLGWYEVVDDVYKEEAFDFETLIKEDINLYARFEENTIEVSFDIDGSITKKTISYGGQVQILSNPFKLGYDFSGWYLGTSKFDFSTKVTSDITLVAKFTKVSNNVITIQYDFGYDCYQSKEDLRVAFYTDFYNFLVDSGYDFKKLKINNSTEFLTFMNLWLYDGRSDMYYTGDLFGRYFVKSMSDGSLEKQPETTFLGWCYKNNKYIDFIYHLETFFAYWRTDEGYSQSDIHGNDFYWSSWASMVDTAKFFYFTSANLQDTYPWFDSERVKDALDNIPGVGYVTLTTRSTSFVNLPTNVTREGYVFNGWVDEQGKKVTTVTKHMKVTATWVKVSPSLDTICADFISDWNKVNGSSLADGSYFDTGKINSIDFVTFNANLKMLSKWMWLYKALADANDNQEMYPDSEGFTWDEGKKFFLPNLCGFFTRSIHTDTYFKTVSADFTKELTVNLVLSKYEE